MPVLSHLPQLFDVDTCYMYIHTLRWKARPLHCSRYHSLLQERHELALGLGIPLDGALRHGQAGMAGELLHVPETAPDLRDFARGAGHEGAAPGVRRTAVHLQRRRE